MSEESTIPQRLRDDATEIAQLVDEIKRSADQLIFNRVDRGDVKLLARSFQELQDSLALLEAHKAGRKVTVFGSARTPRSDPSFQQAIEFGRKMAERDFYVITGAGPGIMEAAHEGAGRDHSIGFNIRLPFEQGANPIVDGNGKLRTLNYFFTRKLLFLRDTEAVVLFPGGFGTMDEGFETLTLMQTGRAKTMPLVLVDHADGTYWDDWNMYVHKHLLGQGLISEEDLSLYAVVKSADDAIAEIDRFYRVYHSQRYVAGKLVLRLRHRIDSIFDEIVEQFADILAPGGRFEQTVAHPHEANEPHLRPLPRLRIDFNRRSFGRLRQLINRINQVEVASERQ